MHKAVIAVVVLLIAVMISTLRMRCSSTSMQLCRRARSAVGTSMQQHQQLHHSIPAALRIPHTRTLNLPPALTNSTLPWLLSKRLRTTTTAAAGSSEGSSNSSKHSPTSVLQAARQLISTAAHTLIAALLLVAVAPYIISSRWGTSAACSVASRMLPGDVRVQRLRLGWSQPLSLEGLSLHEGAAGSSRQLLTVERMSTAGVRACRTVE
jgi:hypothetical protein